MIPVAYENNLVLPDGTELDPYEDLVSVEPMVLEPQEGQKFTLVLTLGSVEYTYGEDDDTDEVVAEWQWCNTATPVTGMASPGLLVDFRGGTYNLMFDIRKVIPWVSKDTLEAGDSLDVWFCDLQGYTYLYGTDPDVDLVLSQWLMPT